MKVLLQIIPSEKSHRNTDEQVSYTSCWPVSQMWQYFCLKNTSEYTSIEVSCKHQNPFPAVKHFTAQKLTHFPFNQA